MHDSAKVFFGQLSTDVETYTKSMSRSVRDALPSAVTSELSPDRYDAVESAIREELQTLVWRFLCHFDNVGCHLPDQILGYTISAMLLAPGATESQDIRVREQDYSDMWLQFASGRDA